MHDLTNLTIDRRDASEALFASEWSEEETATPRPDMPVGAEGYLWLKHAVEWVAALVLLVLASPLLAVLAILVGFTSEGPVGYSQWRVGRFGRQFRIYKLRTMTHQCEAATGAVWAVANDPRTTRVGRWLRDTHLDEIPQLWNVLCGQMSLIGPRPERPEIAAQIEESVPEFRQRLLVRPGITGLAQMCLPADSDLGTVRRKLAHDLYYIRNIGPWFDVRLAMATPLRFLGDIVLSLSRRLARPGPGLNLGAAPISDAKPARLMAERLADPVTSDEWAAELRPAA